MRFKPFIWKRDISYNYEMLVAYVRPDSFNACTLLEDGKTLSPTFIDIPAGYRVWFCDRIRTGFDEQGKPMYESVWLCEGPDSFISETIVKTKEQAQNACFSHHVKKLSVYLED